MKGWLKCILCVLLVLDVCAPICFVVRSPLCKAESLMGGSSASSLLLFLFSVCLYACI